MNQYLNEYRASLFIVGSMQKSGSSWFCNMLVDIVAQESGVNTRDLRKEHKLEKILASYFTPTLLPRMTNKRVEFLADLAAKAGPLVFKTHRKPPSMVQSLVDEGRAKVFYIYRDPRDIIISALDHGVKDRATGKLPISSFARLTNFSKTLNWYRKKVLPTALAWFDIEGVISVRYEDLLQDCQGTVFKVLQQAGLSVPDDKVAEIVSSYQADNVRDSVVENAMHLNRAVIGRYQNAFTEDQVNKIVDVLGDMESLLLYSRK